MNSIDPNTTAPASATAAKGSSTDADAAVAAAALEAAVAAAGRKSHAAWASYLGWAAARPALLLPLLERYVRALSLVPAYRRDIECLMTCVEHTGQCSDPVIVFELLYSQGVGIQFTLLYEGWAVVLEQMKNYKTAAEIYEIGLTNAAKKPESAFEAGFLASLERSYGHFKHRRRRAARSRKSALLKVKAQVKTHERRAYDQSALLTEDGEEMSFEELRAAHWFKQQAAAAEAAAEEPLTAVPTDNAAFGSPQRSASASLDGEWLASLTPTGGRPSASPAKKPMRDLAPSPIPPPRTKPGFGMPDEQPEDDTAFTAKAIFLCLETPDDMLENIAFLCECVTEEPHASTLTASLLHSDRLQRVAERIISAAEAATAPGSDELRTAMLQLLFRVMQVIEDRTEQVPSLQGEIFDYCVRVLGSKEESGSEEEFKLMFQTAAIMTALGATPDSSLQVGDFIETLMDFIVDSESESCLACSELLLLCNANMQERMKIHGFSLTSVARDHDNARYVSESVLRIFNRGHLHVIAPCLQLIGDLFADRSTSDFFYPSDQKVLVDILVRELENLPEELAIRHGYLRVLDGLLLSSRDYSEHKHRLPELISVLKRMVASDELDPVSKKNARYIEVQLR